MDSEDISNDDALLAGGNFDVGTTNLFPTLSEPGQSYLFQSTFSSGSSNNDRYEYFDCNVKTILRVPARASHF